MLIVSMGVIGFGGRMSESFLGLGATVQSRSVYDGLNDVSSALVAQHFLDSEIEIEIT